MHTIDINRVLGRNPELRKKIMLEYANHPQGIADRVITETLGIDQSNLNKQHLPIFKEFDLVEECSVDVKRPMGRAKTETEIIMKGHRLNQTIDTYDVLTKAFDHDHPAQIMFMRSPYYRAMVPDMVDRFIESIPDDDLWKFDTHQHTATREQPLTDDDKDRLTTALIPNWVVKPNWLALKFVAHFISVNSEERSAIIHQLTETTCNRHTSPTAANAAGYRKGVCLGMDRCQQWIRDGAALQYIDERLKAELNNDYTRINWEEFFHQLDHLNANYSYLFD